MKNLLDAKLKIPKKLFLISVQTEMVMGHVRI